MNPAKKSRMVIVGLLALMSLFSIISDSVGVIELFGIMLWCTWAPLLFAILLHRLPAVKSLYAYSLFCAFTATSLFSFVLLSFILIAVIVNGPLNEAGLIYIAFPYGFIQFGVIGAGIGALLWWFMSRRKNR